MTFPRIPLRRTARILNGGTPPSGVAEFWDGEVPFVTPPDLNGLDGAPLESTARTITADGVAHSGFAPAGSVLLSTRAPIGHIARLTSPAAFNQGCRALVPAPNQEARFLAYALVAARADMDARGLGTTFLELSGSSLAQVDVPFAPPEDQRTIADYLDRETAQIDAFIAKNEELITLLTERRLAVISHAVTSGSASNCQTRESGNEWLGSVPNHWEVLKLRHVLAEPITDGPHTTPEFLDDGVPFLSVDGIVDGELEFEGCRYISPTDHEEFSRKASPRRGDVLMGKAASVGKIARVKTDQVFSIWSPLALLRPKPLISPAYMELCLKSASSQAQFAVFANYNTQANISMGDIGEVVIAMPPIDEQLLIVEATQRDLDGIDRAVVVARHSVELARERRAALISAAVTGKIDVGVAV